MSAAVVGKIKNLVFLPSRFPVKLPKTTFPDAYRHPGIGAEVKDNVPRNLKFFETLGRRLHPNNKERELSLQTTANDKPFESVLGGFEALFCHHCLYFDVRGDRQSPEVNYSFIRIEDVS